MYSIALAALVLPALVQATSYNQVKEFVGEQFFDDWNFYNNSAFKQAHFLGGSITLNSNHSR